MGRAATWLGRLLALPFRGFRLAARRRAISELRHMAQHEAYFFGKPFYQHSDAELEKLMYGNNEAYPEG